MKKLILIFMLALLLVGTISAFEFDNVKNVKETYGRAGYKDLEIQNAFGFGDILWSGTIDSNTKKCGRYCSSIQTIDLPKKGFLMNDVIFETILKDGSRIEEPINDFKVYINTGLIPIPVPEYKTQCQIAGNGSETCSRVVSGTHNRYKINWTEYILGTELPAETYEVKLEGDKKAWKTVEWTYVYGSGIGKIKLTEWAPWTGHSVFNDILLYWDFDTVKNNQIEELVGGVYNFTRVGATTPTLIPGILGNSTQTDVNVNWSVRGQSGVPDRYDLGDANFTINFWLNQTAWAANGRLFIGDETGEKVFAQMLGNSLRFDWQSGGAEGDTGFFPSSDGWYMVTIVGNATNSSAKDVYVNGTFNVTLTMPRRLNLTRIFESVSGWSIPGAAPGASFDGAIDEMAIFNVSLDAAQILELYNGGAALPLPGEAVFDITVTLDSPENDSIQSEESIIFTSNFSVSSFNLTNATLKIWYTNGTLRNETFKIITGNTTNSTNISVSGFNTPNNFIWNSEGCGVNVTGTFCEFAENNFTFSWTPFNITNQTFVETVFETSKQMFTANVTSSSDFTIQSADLIYNGTVFPEATTTDLGAGLFFLEREINIPTGEPGFDVENRTFLWNITLVRIATGITSVQESSPVENQTVEELLFGQCGGDLNISVLNFTMRYETNGSEIDATRNATTFQATFNFGIEPNQPLKNISLDNQTVATSRFDFCLENEDNNIVTNMFATYTAVGFTTKNHVLNQANLTNDTSLVDLLLLPGHLGVEFLIDVEQDLSPLPNVTVNIEKFFVGEGVFKTVEISQTDNQGEIVSFLDLNKEYRFTITKNNTLLGILQRTAICQAAPCELTLSIASELGDIYQGFNAAFAENVLYNISFDPGTNIVLFQFIDTTGLATSFRMDVIRGFPNGTGEIVSSQRVFTSSGSITFDASGLQGDFTVKTWIERSPDQFIAFITFVIEQVTENLGLLGLFVAFLAVLTIIFGLSFSPKLLVFSVPLALASTKLMGIISLSNLAITLIFVLAGVASAFIRS